MRGLTEREKEVIKLRLRDRLSVTEIAKRWGTSTANVSKTYKRAISKLDTINRMVDTFIELGVVELPSIEIPRSEVRRVLRKVQERLMEKTKLREVRFTEFVDRLTTKKLWVRSFKNTEIIFESESETSVFREKVYWEKFTTPRIVSVISSPNYLKGESK